MIEPTESEGMETLDAFAVACLWITEEVEPNPQRLQVASHCSPAHRLNEVTASPRPILRDFPSL